MKNKLAAIILLLFLFHYARCQNSNDSLILLLEQSDFWQSKKKDNERRKERERVNISLLELDCENKVLSDSIRALVFFRLALNYENQGDAQQALYYARGGLEYARKYYGLLSIKNMPFLNKLAQTLEYHFDNLEVVLQLRKEITRIEFSIEKISDYEKNIVLRNLLLMGNIYLRIKNQPEFDSVYAQVDQLIRAEIFSKIYDPFEYALFKSYGYLAFGRLEEAYQIIYTQTVLQENIINPNSLQITRLILSQTVLAEIYLAQNKPTEALNLYRKSIFLQNNYAKGALMYEAYIVYVGAQALTTLQQYEESEQILKAVIQKLEAVSHKSNSTHLAELYEQLAKNQFRASQESADKRQLYEAYTYNQQALQFLKVAWQQLKNQDDLKYSLDGYYQVFETSLETLHTLYNQTDSLHYFEEAIRLIELTKNVKLRSSLKQASVAKELGISSHLLARECVFREQLFNLEYEINHTQDADLRQALQDSTLQVNAELIALQESIHRDHPNYTSSLHTQKGFTWEDLNGHLQKENQTLLYFASGEDHLFLLGSSPNGFVFHKAAIGQDSLMEWVSALRENTFTAPNKMEAKQLNGLIEMSARLYKVVLQPIESIATSRLLIIPDGPLEVLPFAMLLDDSFNENTPINQWPFALRQYSFSYAYALDLLLNPNPKKMKASRAKILAFAPDFSASLLRGDATRFQGELENNKEEVNYIKDQFSTTAFLGDQARLSTFRTSVSDYAVLHLATHAVANTELGDYSYLAFSEIDPYDNQLNVGELYTMNIPAELVVLSACETGLGEWQRGEGIIGLERAFSYAGAQSLVTTHWKVSDKASASLMGYFYDELAKGLPKDQALQQAQLAFIDQQDDWLGHPFFWAAYVQKGNTAPLSIPQKKPKWMKWLLAIGLIGGIFVFYKKMQ